MAEISFYNPELMKSALPEPFAGILRKSKGKRISYEEADCSSHNTRVKGKSAKLHPATLSALLRLIQMKEGDAPGACGIQKGDEIHYFLMEYEKPEGRCILAYNYKNGRFSGQRVTGEKREKLLCVGERKSSGEEFLAVLAYAGIVPGSPVYDQEFASCFEGLQSQYSRKWDDPALALHLAFVCCDNLYRRLTAQPGEAIPLERSQINPGGSPNFLAGFKLSLGVYEPNAHIWGKFEYLTAKVPDRERKTTIADMKKLYACGWEVPEESRNRIPSLPENYRVSEDAEEILQRITDTPARMFMLTGSAGGGKTTDAKIIAQVLGLPYYVFTCGPDTDELALLASTVPNMGQKETQMPDFPLFEDMVMDPATALSMLAGEYREGISRETAFGELLKAAYRKGYEAAKQEKDFMLKESEIVKACREACVLEIQEPSAIEKPGTLVRLNSLFDDGACTDLLNGETIVRNPNTIVIMTTNLNYAGCQTFNASVISRMALVQHREELTAEEMMKRAMERTGFDDMEILSFMASTVEKIRGYLEREELQGGICGYRELESWVWSYKATGNLIKSVKNTVISKAALIPEDRKILMDTYIEPYFSA